MKYLGFILVVALVAGQVLAQRINVNDRRMELRRLTRGLSDDLRNYLENFKTTMQVGNAAANIPRLDPYRRNFYAASFNENFMKGDLTLGEFEVLGASQYRVRTADVSVFYRTATISLTWPRLYSFGDYKIDSLLFDNKLVHGEGEYEMTLTNLSIDTVVYIGIWGGLSIKSMETKIALGGCSLSMTGLHNDEQNSAATSEVLSVMVPKVVRKYQNQLTAMFNSKVIVIGNKQLEGMSLSDLWSRSG